MASRTTIAAALALGLGLGAGCFAPFPHDRHDLVDFRIVGVQVSDAAPAPGQIITAKALIYGDAGFYHDVLPTLEWSLGDEVAQGPSIAFTVPDEPGDWELTLVATHADGEIEETAALSLSVGLGLGPLLPPALPPIQRAVVALPLDSPAQAFTLEGRLALEGAARVGPAPGEAARLRLPLDDPEGRYQARWMSAGGQGTFLELDPLSTDWVPAEVLLDAEDLEVEVGEAIEPGLQSMAVLVIDGRGSTAWAFVDVPWDTDPSPTADHSYHWLEHDGRLLDSPYLPTSGGMVEVTLKRDDDSPWGLRLGSIEPYVPWLGESPPDNLTIPCEHPIPARGPFQLAWIAEGLCSREAVLGQRVRIQASRHIETWDGTP